MNYGNVEALGRLLVEEKKYALGPNADWRVMLKLAQFLDERGVTATVAPLTPGDGHWRAVPTFNPSGHQWALVFDPPDLRERYYHGYFAHEEQAQVATDALNKHFVYAPEQ